MLSPLVWGEWIEIAMPKAPFVIASSPLVWGEWIEIETETKKAAFNSVSPRVGGVD